MTADPETLADRLEGVLASADCALTEDEIEYIGDAIEFLRSLDGQNNSREPVSDPDRDDISLTSTARGFKQAVAERFEYFEPEDISVTEQDGGLAARPRDGWQDDADPERVTAYRLDRAEAAVKEVHEDLHRIRVVANDDSEIPRRFTVTCEDFAGEEHEYAVVFEGDGELEVSA